MTGPRKCRKCGQNIRLRVVDHNPWTGAPVRKWCRADDQGSPQVAAGGQCAPMDCPRGGCHLLLRGVTEGIAV